LRLLVGEQATAATSATLRPQVESIVLLEANLDDCPGDAIGHAIERLFAAGRSAPRGDEPPRHN
jgi:uncharacterized protein (DUF111 family)